MKIVLVVPPVYGTLHPPLSLALLSGALKAHSYLVKSFDFNIELYRDSTVAERQTNWDLSKHLLWENSDFVTDTVKPDRFEAWAGRILAERPDVVGFSVYISNLVTSVALARIIKERAPSVKVVFGGPYCRRDNGIAEGLVRQGVDFVVVGEGEEALRELLVALEHGGPEGPLPGIVMNRAGTPSDGGPREPVRDLESLAFPDFSDFDFGIYRDRIIPVLMSRGCVFNCAFCNEKTYWRKFRTRSGRRTADEIRYLYTKHGIDHFRFNDLLMNGDLSAMEELCDTIIGHNLRIRWGGYISARKMGDDLIRKLKQAGCYFLFIGVETGSQRMLDRYKKGVNAADAETLVRRLHEAGIEVHTGWIVGFPDEWFADFMQTVEFVRRNRQYLTYISEANLMSIPPGSPIALHPAAYGVHHIVHAGEWTDDMTTPAIRRARLAYFNTRVRA